MNKLEMVPDNSHLLPWSYKFVLKVLGIVALNFLNMGSSRGKGIDVYRFLVSPLQQPFTYPPKPKDPPNLPHVIHKVAWSTQ